MPRPAEWTLGGAGGARGRPPALHAALKHNNTNDYHNDSHNNDGHNDDDDDDDNHNTNNHTDDNNTKHEMTCGKAELCVFCRGFPVVERALS